MNDFLIFSMNDFLISGMLFSVYVADGLFLRRFILPEPLLSLSRSDQTFFIVPDQILSACFNKRFPHQLVIGGIAVLDQRPLHGLFVGIFTDID